MNDNHLRTNINMLRREMVPDLTYTPADLNGISLVGGYSVKRVLMYMLYEGTIVRVGKDRFALAD